MPEYGGVDLDSLVSEEVNCIVYCEDCSDYPKICSNVKTGKYWVRKHPSSHECEWVDVSDEDFVRSDFMVDDSSEGGVLSFVKSLFS